MIIVFVCNDGDESKCHRVKCQGTESSAHECFRENVVGSVAQFLFVIRFIGARRVLTCVQTRVQRESFSLCKKFRGLL